MAPAIISTNISNVARWFAPQPPKHVWWFTSQDSRVQRECQVLQHEYLIGVEEAQNCNGQLGEEDQCQAEGELEEGGH